MAPSTCCVCLVRFSTNTVNLPDIVAHTTMDPESVSILREHLNEFLAFLAKEQPRLFVREYEAPSQAYQRLGST